MMNKFCSQINNAYSAKQLYVMLKYKKSYMPVLQYLFKKGYIHSYRPVITKSTLKKSSWHNLLIQLKYKDNKPLFHLKQISRPSNKVYYDLFYLRLLCQKSLSDGSILLTTNRGICDQWEALNFKVGGKAILNIVFFDRKIFD